MTDSKDIPWRERPLINLQTAAKILGMSVASIYRFEKEGRVSFKRLAGRTLIETASLVALVDSAESWSSSPRAAEDGKKFVAKNRDDS